MVKGRLAPALVEPMLSSLSNKIISELEKLVRLLRIGIGIMLSTVCHLTSTDSTRQHTRIPGIMDQAYSVQCWGWVSVWRSTDIA